MTGKRAAIVAAGITLSLFLASCGEADEPAVATAATGGPAASASAAGGVVAAYVAMRRKWAACMREQGFDWPDPDAKGQFTISADTNRKWKADPRVGAAHEACKQFQTEVPAELEPELEPLTPEQIGWARDYAKCMRENGMPDWPDPDVNGRMPQDQGGGELTPQEQAANIRALQICEPVTQGRPKTTPDPNATYQG